MSRSPRGHPGKKGMTLGTVGICVRQAGLASSGMINSDLFVHREFSTRSNVDCVLPRLFAVSRLVVLLLGASSVISAVAATSPAKGGVDEHTVALWLFDETLYPGTILTDASPYHHDLRLVTAYETWWHKNEHSDKGGPEALHVKGESGLIKGKFGNALKLPAGDGTAVIWPDHKTRYGSYFLLDRGSEVPERLNLGYLDWTLELWFKGTGTQVNLTPSISSSEVVIGFGAHSARVWMIGNGHRVIAHAIEPVHHILAAITPW